MPASMPTLILSASRVDYICNEKPIISPFKIAGNMSMTNRKRRLEARDHKAARKFSIIVGIATVLLMLLLYLVYRSAS